MYKEIQKWSSCKVIYVWLTASSYMGKYLLISSYIRKPFLIYDFATASLWISLYMCEENLIFFFYQCTLWQALHFNTFGGNPMASAVGLSVLEAIQEDGCQHNSLEVGNYLLDKLVKLVDK